MSTAVKPPRDNLVRASAGGFVLRTAADGGMPTLVGHAAVFNQWTRIDSSWEGLFLERIAPGAFKQTLATKRDAIKILFQHGQDPQVGDKPLAPLEEAGEDDTGLHYTGRMLDTTYNRDLIPGLEAGLYGSSFRFRIPEKGDRFVRNPGRSDYNPDGIPERTVTEAEVFEFGPVTFPAYPGAEAGLRSMTDQYVLRTLAEDPKRLARLVASITPRRSLDDVATALLADKAALAAAVTKLGNGEPLTAAEADLLEKAIDQLEPPDCCTCCSPGCPCCGWDCTGEACCAAQNATPDSPMNTNDQMKSTPKTGAERDAHSGPEPVKATPERASTPTARKPISRDDFLAKLQEINRS